MEQASEPTESVALVVGVTGMAGMGLVEVLKKPDLLGVPWKVYATARRAGPPWFPTSGFLDGYIAFDATDSEDTRDKLSPIAGEVTHVFWVQAIEVRLLKSSTNPTMLANVLHVLTTVPTSPRLRHVMLQTGTRHYMRPLKEGALSDEHAPHEIPFSEEYHRLPYPNFYYI